MGQRTRPRIRIRAPSSEPHSSLPPPAKMRSMIQPHRKGSRRKVISGCSNHTVGCARNTLKSLLLLHCDDLNIPASVAASTTPDTTVQPATSRISTPSARRRRRRRLDNELVPLGSSVSDGVEGCHCSQNSVESVLA